MMRRLDAVLGLFAVVFAVWCTGAAAAPTLSPSDAAPEEQVTVAIRARQFLPPVVMLHAGRKTRLIFKNHDAELHTVVPGSLFAGVNLNVGGNGAPEFSDAGFKRVIIPPDGTAEFLFVHDRPGRYPFACDMPGHEMRATIVVE